MVEVSEVAFLEELVLHKHLRIVSQLRKVFEVGVGARDIHHREKNDVWIDRGAGKDPEEGRKVRHEDAWAVGGHRAQKSK